MTAFAARTPAAFAALAVAAMLLNSTCGGGSPTGPSGPEPPPVTVVVLTGQIVDGTSNLPIAGATIHVDGFTDVISGAGGNFSVTAAETTPTQVLPATIVAPGMVDRSTRVRLRGPHAVL